MFSHMKDQTLREIVIMGFVITVVLQVALMLKQYQMEQTVQTKRGAYATPSELCQSQGMMAHFSERTGQYDGCVSRDYTGM